MEPIGTIGDATAKVLNDLRRCVATVRRLAARQFKTPDDGVALLRELRKATYEEINQIQHEHSILKAAQWLVENQHCPHSTAWSWNPRQTGTADEPDLEGRHKGAVVVSA